MSDKPIPEAAVEAAAKAIDRAVPVINVPPAVEIGPAAEDLRRTQARAALAAAMPFLAAAARRDEAAIREDDKAMREAITRTLSAWHSTTIVGGLTDRQAWQIMERELGPYRIEYTAQGGTPQEDRET